ncbi:hypothetical protein Desde_1434 [Desulfitobacterium dehalogenans ATCC 51507]|uniref:ABC transporter substrate-binding protein n=1 Tax=Desulfitobacterium dehalogenans (strain ATCC 51507 / DSM 9161 / JW/IU-DC1) TaxID=756499 RepID=I4A7B9_DESDJ|nr:hypothetical protein [Desulfitobacterium dehalogenans]AFL99853.1 hypothetical protein Desde_1434 [Desulfitobacterium dehalogenans ATCC 51507]
MKLKTKLFALLMAAMLAVSLVGCGQSTPASSNPPAAGGEAAPTERTVTDMAGRTVTLPAEVKTVGTIGSIGVLNAFVETLSAGERIANEGSPSFVKSPSWEKYQYKFTPQIKDLKPFQGADSELLMENILAANPDICLTMSSDLTEQLEKHGEGAYVVDKRKQVTRVLEGMNLEVTCEMPDYQRVESCHTQF